jgi:muramoyltetrapeptide carboxypeptidase
MEILPMMNWKLLKLQPPKWILGYSDISTFTFAYTLLTGHATAHGPNYIDLGSEHIDHTTAEWLNVLSTIENGTVKQLSSKRYRSSYQVTVPDQVTNWSSLDTTDNDVRFSGRLIGGCMETISILIGTTYAPIEQFAAQYCKEEGVIWYLESCEMNAADIYRHLWQMRECGWFQHSNGILIGRAAGYSSRKNFELVDALQNVFGPLGLPVIYDVDIGHTSPQITLVNGAVAEVFYSKGQGEVTITFA